MLIFRAKLPIVVVKDDSDADDVIDLGAPRVVRQLHGDGSTLARPSTSPPTRIRRAYVPNPRL